MIHQPAAPATVEPSATRPQPSRPVRFLWWLLVLGTLLNLLTELDTALFARSADEALGSAFLMAPVMFLMFVTAIVVFVGSLFRRGKWRKPDIVLSLSTLPVILFMAWTSELLGWPRQGSNLTILEILSIVAGTAVVLALMLLFQRRVLLTS